MKKFYRDLVRLLISGENVVLATVYHSSGSAPRSAGAKMLVCSDGSIIGTVGGGRLEAETIKLAQKVHASRRPVIQAFDLTGKEAAGLGMICGGSGEIFVDYIDAADNDTLQIYETVLDVMTNGQKAWLVTELIMESGTSRQQCLIKQDGSVIGSFQCDHDFMAKLTSAPARISIHADALENRRYIVEPIKNTGVVYLFGAGHVSRQIARLTDMVGFKTVVLDDRPAFANQERFPAAEIIVIDSFQFLPKLDINEDSYLVIVTRGHVHDSIVLEQVLPTNPAYIGMIGSRRKRDSIYKSLEEKGFESEALKKVYSPIGIAIAAETPEEIAVSIAAELIKVRAEQEKCAPVQ